MTQTKFFISTPRHTQLQHLRHSSDWRRYLWLPRQHQCRTVCPLAIAGCILSVQSKPQRHLLHRSGPAGPRTGGGERHQVLAEHPIQFAASTVHRTVQGVHRRSSSCEGAEPTVSRRSEDLRCGGSVPVGR